MSKDDQRAFDLSGLELVLCVLAVCGGVAAAAYLYWTVHWIAAVVITVYLLIFLTDVCLKCQHSVTWYLLDFLHHLLSFAGTALIASHLWRINVAVGTLAILPVFVLLLTITNFLMVTLYGLTPAGRAHQEAQKHRPALQEVVSGKR